MQKLQARKIALHQTSAIPEGDKEKWEEGLIPELISSEESDGEDGFMVHPLPWRSERVNKLFASLDHKNEKRRSHRSKVMTQKRYEGIASDRPVPLTAPDWAVKK